MISVFVGADTQKAREALHKAIDGARADYPEATVSRFDDVSFDFALAREALHAENLFGGGNILIFDGILDHKDGEDFYRTALEKTEHIVFIRETAPGKDILAFFARVGEVQEFPLQKKLEKRENSFAIADAIGAHDKKTAWVEFEKVRRGGSAMEEVHGTITWAVKSMYIASTQTKEDALATGMKDYTYRTYKNYAGNYSAPTLTKMLAQLKDMYHEAHRGGVELEIALEQFLLNL